MIEVNGLTKYYGSTLAVDNISFSVAKGEIIGLLGPNGAGKTTIMRMLTCFLPATSGQAKIAGLDVIADSLAIRRRLGYLPENPPLYPELKVETYLKFMAQLKEVPRKKIKERVETVLEMFKINDMRHKIIDHLSRGYRQRVGLAQALINEPEVIILDEPTVGLDPKQIQEVRATIKNLARKHTVILSTHILPEVNMTCDRIIILNQGKIAAVDTIENLELQMRALTRLRLRVRGKMPQIEQDLLQMPGVVSVLPASISEEEHSIIVEGTRDRLQSEQITKMLVEKGWGLKEIYQEKATLEEIYLNLVTREDENKSGSTLLNKKEDAGAQDLGHLH